MGSNLCVRISSGTGFAFVRQLERMFSPDALRRVVSPIIAARISFKRRRRFLPLPQCLGEGSFSVSHQQLRKDALNSMLEFFPERLGTSKWRDRLQIEGLEYLESARRQKRPVILAFSHFGPYVLQRYWLRAIGFPSANLVGRESRNRSVMKRLKDRASPFPEIPTALYQRDQLREAVGFLAAGNALLIAIDVPGAKQINIPVDKHWQFGMASGAVRMAMHSSADLIPCSIIDLGAWHFRMQLGPPVPAGLLASVDLMSAGKHLLDALLPVWRKYPDQSSECLLNRFVRIDSKNTSPHECVSPDQLTAR